MKRSMDWNQRMRIDLAGLATPVTSGPGFFSLAHTEPVGRE
jgi:hypothetical protein